MVCTQDNPDGPITNSDLEVAGMLIFWLVMEEVAPCLRHKRVGLYCDNLAAVSWVARTLACSSKVAGLLLVTLALRLNARQDSPLTPLHISRVENGIGDIPLRYFGGTPEWHCRTNAEFLILFN